MTRLIAEIGQNHQASVEVAKDLVRIAAHPKRGDLYGEDYGGVDAVKLTKRSLAHELSRDAWAAPYSGDNAFGATYGAHRTALELTDEQHAEVYRYAKSLGLDFIETLCHPTCLSILDHFVPDALKVASRDIDNLPLLDALAQTRLPIIISTGMAGQGDLDRALDVVTRQHEDITILHCVSTYPTPPEDVNLETIPWLKERYPYRIGYSCHAIGIWAATAAVAMGAEVVEKHVTLDRMMRGGDHLGALERDGVWRWVRDTRLVEQARGERTIRREASADVARRKLARSVATTRTLPAGITITPSDLQPLSPGTGIPWPEHTRFLGRTTIAEVPQQALLATTAIAPKRDLIA